MVSRFDGEVIAFRIAGPGFPVFDGGGAMRRAGRWTTPPRQVINCASVYALAVLENLVHWNIGKLPPGMCFVRCVIPEGVGREILAGPDLPGWDRPDYRASQRFGDAWFDEGRSPVLIVPSVLSPFEPNVLINQKHMEFSRIRIDAERSVMLDPRLVAR